MTQLHTLNKVVELAEKRRDEALAVVAQMQREKKIAQDQMDQLQAYALEAETRWVARSAAGVDTAMLMHHREFMHKIYHAVEFQRGVLADRQRLIDTAQEQVHVTERDLMGLRRFTERKQQAIQQKVQRQEQKQTDEMALSIHLRHALAQAQARH